MSVNKEIAARLEEIAEMQQLTGANQFRAASNSRAARNISELSRDLTEIAGDRDALMEIDGVGEQVADKIIEYIETGDMKEHKGLREQVPAGVLQVLRVPGVGPKTAKALWEDLKVESVDDLKKAIENESILDLPRMGKKTVENIKKAIQFSEESGGRTPIGRASPIADRMVERLREVNGAKRVEVAGSIRRGKETIGDIDILACGKDAKALAKAFREMPEVTQVLAAGETKSSVRARIEEETGAKPARTLQIDLRLIPEESFGAALMYFTGSKQHNVRLRERAIRRGYTLNEYGLFPEKENDDKESPPQERGVEAAASETEEDIYEELGLPFIPAEMREDRGEVDLNKKSIPDLVCLEDIKCELHAHTTASDGQMSIEELAGEAKSRGFHTIAVTDHSKSQVVASGLSVDRLFEHIEAVHEASEKVKGITILAGTEVDILSGGKLDYDDDVLKELDIVVASPHSNLKQSSKDATKRLLAAIENPYVNIIGHPTGRLVNKREGLSPDIDAIVKAAANNDTALEINAHWMRLDLRDTHVRAAVDAGCLIAIDCDVHGAPDMDNLRFGVMTARRGWLPKDQCVNTWSMTRLEKWLRSKRGKSDGDSRSGGGGSKSKRTGKKKKSGSKSG